MEQLAALLIYLIALSVSALVFKIYMKVIEPEDGWKSVCYGYGSGEKDDQVGSTPERGFWVGWGVTTFIILWVFWTIPMEISVRTLAWTLIPSEVSITLVFAAYRGLRHPMELAVERGHEQFNAAIEVLASPFRGRVEHYHREP